MRFLLLYPSLGTYEFEKNIVSADNVGIFHYIIRDNGEAEEILQNHIPDKVRDIDTAQAA
jgi:hypothetical protein